MEIEIKKLNIPSSIKKLKKLPCQYSTCQNVFETIREVIDHIKNIHPIQCPLCSQIFSSPQIVKQHFKKNHETSIPYFCNFCTLVSTDENLIRDHMKKEHGVGFLDINYHVIKTCKQPIWSWYS